ncbi:hypothetical protein RN001_001583 [Aquatica leii]|uniref:Uncharacterized protein n=1 Tax=Aquatica leii TaxID=1421715 RepID=A0AAN7PG60_9COLE|nr:hypothetical protein RN001_001583 [Aquatica leii]
MEDIQINNYLGEDSLDDSSEITPEPDIFIDEPIQVVEISNSDMYISLFSDDSDEDYLDKSNKNTFIKCNTSKKNLSYERENDLEFTYGQISENYHASSNSNETSLFSDEDVDYLLECNEMVIDPLFCDHENEENVPSEMKINPKDNNKNATLKGKKRRKLYSEKSWIGSDNYIRLNQGND